MGDMVFIPGHETGAPRALIVLQVDDTVKPRYGNLTGTKRRYKLVDPATGATGWVPETQVAAEFTTPDS